MIPSAFKPPVLVAKATAFIASFCIMVVELTAGRMAAPYIGTSVYTWMAVIGVVLAGVAVGNYAGGRVADRWAPTHTLALLFLIASAACALIPTMNRLVGSWELFWDVPWTVRVVLHVAYPFLAPSLLLGMIGPVVTKAALEAGGKAGWTIGSVFAWSAMGSIVGTFVTGFFLTAVLGTTATCWAVAGVLALMGMFFSLKKGFSFLWTATLICLAVASMGTWSWAQAIGQSLGLRELPDPTLVYQRESPYFLIRVVRPANMPQLRKLNLDHFLHSIVDLDDPGNVDGFYQYPYQPLSGAITRRVVKEGAPLRALIVGGGGYVFPRYLEQTFPGSRIDVVELDPEVTEAAFHTLGLSRDTPLRIHHQDGRTYVDELIRANAKGQVVASYDVICTDAVRGVSVPYQLTTREFNRRVRALLAPDGSTSSTSSIATFREGSLARW